ncbi:MAG: CHAD domain-containing protein [Thermoguttaceae bacterium]|jgi:CHAD domain-containing protein|nr:CHAD domain-containing protein [Thermoguttaceae bacterium]
MNPFQTTADEGLCVLAAKHFRQQAQRLSAQFEGIRAAEDIECIHRARVASRRLRAGLRMFQDHLQPEVYRRWRKHIRRVTSGLGDARDKDVQIEFLCRAFCELHEASLFPGVARLLADLEKQRERVQPKVVEAVDRIERSRVLDEMQAALKEVRGTGKSDKAVSRSAAVYREAEQRINAQLEELLGHEGGLADPSASAEHHAMRIAAKRLRYTIEIVKPVYDKSLDAMLKAVKRIQTLLGDIHDCDVWAERLDVFAERQRQRIIDRFGHEGPYARLAVGIRHLQDARAHDRKALFCELAGYWAELTRQGAWDELRRLARAPGEREETPPGEESPQSSPCSQNGRGEGGNGRSLQAIVAACADNLKV